MRVEMKLNEENLKLEKLFNNKKEIKKMSKTNLVLVEVYNIYGKNDSNTLIHSEVMEDTLEERKLLVDEYCWDDYNWDLNDFLAGKGNQVTSFLYGGDWDDPTSREIIITTYEEKRERIQKVYDEGMAKLNEQFGIK